MLVGPSQGTIDSDWNRVQMTLVGVSLYLVIDNAFFPDRSDVYLKNIILESVFQFKMSLSDTMDSLRSLLLVAGVELSDFILTDDQVI